MCHKTLPLVFWLQGTVTDRECARSLSMWWLGTNGTCRICIIIPVATLIHTRTYHLPLTRNHAAPPRRLLSAKMYHILSHHRVTIFHTLVTFRWYQQMATPDTPIYRLKPKLMKLHDDTTRQVDNKYL